MANPTHTDPLTLIRDVQALVLQHREFATSGDKPKDRLMGYKVAGQELTIGVVALKNYVASPPGGTPEMKASLSVMNTPEGRLAIVNASLALQMAGDLVVVNEVDKEDLSPLDLATRLASTPAPTHKNVYTLVKDAQELAATTGDTAISHDDPKRLLIGYLVGDRYLTISIRGLRDSIDNPPEGWTEEQIAKVRGSMKTAQGRFDIVRQPL